MMNYIQIALEVDSRKTNIVSVAVVRDIPMMELYLHKVRVLRTDTIVDIYFEIIQTLLDKTISTRKM